MITVTAHTFAESSDDAIIASARHVLSQRDPKSLRPCHRQLLRSRNPDVMVAGKFLWAHLTKQKES